MQKKLVDTILYNPSIEVYKVDKEKGIVYLNDFLKNRKYSTKLIKSKQNKEHFYFRVSNRTYWLDTLFSI